MMEKRENLEELKSKVDLVLFFEHQGVKLTKKHGDEYSGLCPFHPDTKPSLYVNRKKRVFKCFGCNEEGNIFEAVKLLMHCDFKKAVNYVAEFAETGRCSPVLIEHKKEPVIQIEEDPVSNVTLGTAAEHYHKKLFKSKIGITYLTKTRKIDAKLINRFKIGYADGSLLKIISNGQKEAFIALGILKTTEKGRIWEFFTGCLTFPIFDDAGKVIHFYGRKADPAADHPHLYLSGRHISIFNRKASHVYDTIILVESVLDCLSLITMGFENVQPLYGVGTLTEEHIRILKNDRVKTVILALDNDAVGRNGCEKHKTTLLNTGFSVKVITPPSGKDWNDCLLAGTSKEDVVKLIEEAEVLTPPKDENKRSFTACKQGFTYLFQIGDISYRLKGVPKLFVASLRVNIKAVFEEKKHLDTVDICTVRGRKTYSRDAAEIFETGEARIREDLLTIVDWLEDESKEDFTGTEEKRELSSEEIKLGMSLLIDPNLTDIIVKDMETVGYVGEEPNKILMYLIATSRKMDDPVSGLVIAQSGSGKTRLVETVQKLIPEDEMMEITSVSDQAFNYVAEGGLINKFLILGEAVHSEIVEHQIRDMLSSRKLNRLVTVKDKTTGEMVGKNISTRVVVASAQTTTRHNINPENASRCFIINTDESRQQTKRIHLTQNKKYTLERYREKKVTIPKIVRKHHAAQRLLLPRVIFNPYADSLEFPDTVMRLRRDYERFLDLIATVCFLRQYQKKEKQGLLSDTGEKFHYIECDFEDYRIAYEIIKHILPATLASLPSGSLFLYDELLAYTRGKAKEQLIKPGDVKFRQREVSEARGLQPHFVKRYIRSLVEYEFIARVAGYHGGTYSYRLVKDEEIQLFDISMIPSPDEIRERSGNRDKSPK